MEKNKALNAKQQRIVPIAAYTANGDMHKLKTALNEGLDAGLTVMKSRKSWFKFFISYWWVFIFRIVLNEAHI